MQKEIVNSLLNEYKSCFASNYNELGCCKLNKIKINTSSTIPIYQLPYRKSFAERQLIKEEVNRMLEANIIRPSKSPWASPVVMIPKKDGSKRFCVDYRKLNLITIQDCFPMPRMDDIFDRLSGAKWFSIIDLKNGYWQSMMDEESIEKTAFNTPDGHFEFIRLPFGLKNAPAEFNRLMTQILGDLPYVQIYLDDITVFSTTFEEHTVHIRNVLERLKQADLKINSSKCVFLKQNIKLLGHVISDKGIEADPEKVEAIQNIKYCKNVKQVQSYLGLCGYYRKFIRDYSKIAQPLHNLTKKDTKFEFNEECKQSFDKLKAELLKQPILRLPDFSKKFILHTDASGFALGAVLSQCDDNGDEYYTL